MLPAVFGTAQQAKARFVHSEKLTYWNTQSRGSSGNPMGVGVAGLRLPSMEMQDAGPSLSRVTKPVRKDMGEAILMTQENNQTPECTHRTQ